MLVSVAPTQTERMEARSFEVDEWTAEAARCGGVKRRFALQRAVELAREHGVPGRLDDLRRQLDNLAGEPLTMGTLSVPIEIPTEEVDRYVDAFVAESGWEESLNRFGWSSGSPPSGDADRNAALIEELRAETPLQYLIPKMIVDDKGRPVASAKDDASHTRLAILQHEQMGILLWADLAMLALERIAAKHGPPASSSLEAFFESEVIDADQAKKLARAVQLYLDGQYDESAHILVPRLEAVLRKMARLVRIPVFRETFKSETGGVAPLGSLLHAMSGRIDESWRRYLLNALVEPLGLNLRNRISHGLVGEVHRRESIVLIHIACHLRQLRPQPNQPDAPTS
jgi:hypothetical protein